MLLAGVPPAPTPSANSGSRHSGTGALGECAAVAQSRLRNGAAVMRNVFSLCVVLAPGGWLGYLMPGNATVCTVPWMEMGDDVVFSPRSSMWDLKCPCCEEACLRVSFLPTATPAEVDGSGGPHPQGGPEERRKREWRAGCWEGRLARHRPGSSLPGHSPLSHCTGFTGIAF